MKRCAVAVVWLLLALGSMALAQTQEGCFPLAQSSSGPESLTMWCQIVDYSQTSPLSPAYTSEFITLQRSVSATDLHVQYDNWYSAMDFTFQLELLHGSQDVVTVPFTLNYDGLNTLITDIPLSVSLKAGDRIRIIQSAFIPHPCGLVDNCGLHVSLTFQ